MTALRLPGLIDVHVHLREPGGEHKEDISTGSAAALAGGVTMVLDMPNTYPPLVDAESLAAKRELISRRALCDIGLYIGASETNASEAAGLASQAIALKIYLDQTYGPLQMRSLAALLSHFRTWPATQPIAVHAEGLSIAIAIGLARVYARRLHLCHVSRADEIALIRAAKESGAVLTCEVTPHHLFLTEADARQLGPYGFMKPPLATTADVAALWANLDVVACIATDALGPEHVVGVRNPSRYTSDMSNDVAARLAANLGIRLLTIPIEPAFEAYLEMLADQFAGTEAGVTEENIQARIRGNLWMALSNKFGWLVLTAGNKSEMSVGYATLYGDMAGGFAVIKDVPKTLVYELAEWRNTQGAGQLPKQLPVIPEDAITRPPTAELRPGQKDTDSLPPYPVLDPILKAYVEEDRRAEEIAALGFDPETVRRVIRMVDRSEYKRRQAPPGVRITQRAFGRDRRLPITNWFKS